ncbi:hypothetical protein [Bacillus cereus]|uniref:hypothetical protein n=1 Tax=Bacillus cereus TaxID=1396 RepID=UPI0024BC46A9|nr:hypothetical protein [Bacillus cereus]WLG16086.1 hypothetical protein QM226_005556 [Bacillus cereus]
MERTNQDLNKLTNLEYDKVPKFMRGAIGKKYGFNSLSRDIVGFLRNRMSVSVKNGWKEDGRYYVKASSKEMCDEFVTTNKTLDKALKIVEDIGYISSKKGFNSSKKFFIDFEIEARLNEEYLQWKEENKSVGMHTDKLNKSDSLGESPELVNNEDKNLDINSLGNIPILNESSNNNSLGNIPSQFRKNSYLERSTLERRTKKIKNNICFFETLKAFSIDYVSLQDKSEEWFTKAAEKLEKEYDSSKGTPSAFVREHLRRNSLIEEGQADEVFVPEYKKESEEPQEKKQATVEDRLKAAITEKGYEHPHVVEGIMKLVNNSNDYAKSLLPKLQRRKCLVDGKTGVTYTAEYSAYLKSNSDVPFSEFLTSYNPIMSNGKPLVV